MVEVDGLPNGRELYSSVSMIGQSQYPTLPVGATANGMWAGTQYPPLARSISHRSAGGQSDSVFLDGYVEDSCPPSSPGRYSKDPTMPNGLDGELETDGHMAFLSHTVPRGTHTQPGKGNVSSAVKATHFTFHNVTYLTGIVLMM